MASDKSELSSEEKINLFSTLKTRFEEHMQRHENLNWEKIEAKLNAQSDKLLSVYKMEESGGEPDIIGYDEKAEKYIFCDCSPESPKGRRSVCYDKEALESRKKYKPENNALDMAEEIGIELLTEEQYRKLQQFGNFDTKTSSWLKTPSDIRKLGGAIFGDFRYGTVFIYHNGAESYYAARGFRGLLRV